MEDFTDGEDFMTGSPRHTNPFRDEANLAESLKRIQLANTERAALTLPLALEPRPDSPDGVKIERESRNVE